MAGETNQRLIKKTDTTKPTRAVLFITILLLS
jgi:hypothetical protein